MLKRILLTIALAASVGGAVAACGNSATPTPSIVTPSVEASVPAAESPSEAAPSVEASAAPSAS
jgi:hypothetical protein